MKTKAMKHNESVASPTRVNLKDNELTLERFQTLYLDIFL